MANKVIKGLTIEIGGDTTNLGKALDAADKQSRALSGELRQIDKLLQFDSANPEMLAQKQEVLAKQISNTEEKLKLLKAAQEQANEAVKNGETIGDETFRALEREIQFAENALKKYQTAADDTAQKISDVGANTAETAEAVKPLTETVKAQEAELSKLKADYVNVAAAQGADSEEAKKLLSAIGNLSGELSENQKKVQAAKQAADEYDSTIAKNATTTLSLTETVKAQEKELSALKSQYADTAAAQGADSDAARQLASQIETLSAEVVQNQKKLTDAEKAADGFDKSMQQAGTGSKTLKQTIADQKTELSGLKEQYAETVAVQGRDSEEARRLAAQITALSGDLRTNEQRMNEAENAADDLDKTVENLGNDEKETDKDSKTLGETLKDALTAGASAAGDALKSLADIAASAISAAIDAAKSLASYSIEVGKNFESSMAKVAAVSGATGEELDKLTEKAKEMGATTQFSASEAADAMNYMAMAGWKTEDMLGGISGIMDLAAASGADLATTSDIVTDALTGMGYGAEDAGHLADVMAAAASNANTNVEMMGATFKYAAPIVGSLGYSMEDTAIATGLMANAGIKAEQAGTSLRSILTRLSTDAGASSKSLGALGTLTQELGVEFYNADGTTRELNDVLKEARAAWGDLSAEQQTSYAKIIAGQNAMSGWLAIMNAADADVEKLSSAIRSSGYDIDAVNKSLEKSGIDWGKYSDKVWLADGAIEGLADEIIYNVNEIGTSTEDLREYLESEYDLNADDAIKAIEAVTYAMESSEGAAKRMASQMNDTLEGDIKSLGSKAEALGITFYESMNAPLRDLVQLGGSFITKITDGIKSGGIEGAAAALGDVIGQALSKLNTYLPSFAKVAANIVKSLAKSLKDSLPAVLAAIKEAIPVVIESLKESIPAIMELGGGILMAFVDGVVENIDQVIDLAITVIQTLVDGLIANLPKIMDAAVTLVVKLADALTENIDTVISSAVLIITTLAKSLLSKDNISKIIHAAIELMLALAKALTNQETLDTLISAAPQIIHEVVTALIDNAPALLTAAIEIIATIADSLLSNLDQIWEAGKSIIISLGKGIWNALGELLKVLAGIGEELGYKAYEWVEDAKQWGKDLIENFIAGVKEAWNKWEGFWEDVGGTIYDYLHHSTPEKGPLKDDDKWGADFMENFIDSAAGKEDELVKTVDDIADSVSDAMRIAVPEIEIPDFDMPDYPDTPVKLPVTIEPKLDRIDPEFSFDGIQRSLHMTSDQTVIMTVDPGTMEKLDQILGAIEDGKDILLDGDKLVGGTAGKYNTAFGEMQILSERSVQ